MSASFLAKSGPFKGEEEEAEQFSLDLNSLAKQYQSQTENVLQAFERREPDDEFLSSIDLLVDSFFTKGIEPEKQSDSEGLEEFNLNDTLTCGFDVTLNRTKSISIARNQEAETSSGNSVSAAYSLSELANEYLASNTPVSGTTASLVDLIDCEFNSTLTFEPMNQIHLNKEELLKKKHLKNGRVTCLSNEENTRLSSSLTFTSNLTKPNEVSSSSYNSEGLKETFVKRSNSNVSIDKKCSLEKISLMLMSEKDKECQKMSEFQSSLQDVYWLDEESVLGNFFKQQVEQHCESIDNDTNKFLEQLFDYSRQKQFLKAQLDLSLKRRKKVFIQTGLSRLDKKFKASNTAYEIVKLSNTNNELGEASSSSSSSLTNPNHSNTTSRAVTSKTGRHRTAPSLKSSHKSHHHLGKEKNKKISIFDFSIPSPDDIVIAKQKFAFKNMRFK